MQTAPAKTETQRFQQQFPIVPDSQSGDGPVSTGVLARLRNQKRALKASLSHLLSANTSFHRRFEPVAACLEPELHFACTSVDQAIELLVVYYTTTWTPRTAVRNRRWMQGCK